MTEFQTTKIFSPGFLILNSEKINVPLRLKYAEKNSYY